MMHSNTLRNFRVGKLQRCVQVPLPRGRGQQLQQRQSGRSERGKTSGGLTRRCLCVNHWDDVRDENQKLFIDRTERKLYSE